VELWSLEGVVAKHHVGRTDVALGPQGALAPSHRLALRRETPNGKQYATPLLVDGHARLQAGVHDHRVVVGQGEPQRERRQEGPVRVVELGGVGATAELVGAGRPLVLRCPGVPPKKMVLVVAPDRLRADRSCPLQGAVGVGTSADEIPYEDNPVFRLERDEVEQIAELIGAAVYIPHDDGSRHGPSSRA
jgi:hypothetical protein